MCSRVQIRWSEIGFGIVLCNGENLILFEEERRDWGVGTSGGGCCEGEMRGSLWVLLDMGPLCDGQSNVGTEYVDNGLGFLLGVLGKEGK